MMKFSDTFKAHFKDETGSSSILVIILMVVLMVFGLAVLTTSLSNLRLAEKKRDWLQDYYNVEAEVEYELALIDGLLKQVEVEALVYMDTKQYVDDYMIDDMLDEEMTANLYKIVYLDTATEVLLEHIAGDTSASLTVNDVDIDEIFEGKDLNPSLLTFDKTLANAEYPKHITVTLEIQAPNSSNISLDGSMLQHFSIHRYTQWQDPFEYEDGLDFDDPFEGESGTEDSNPFGEDDNELNANPFGQDD